MNILFCNWRDSKNPEGGGSERYVENMARGLASAGHCVTIACAMYDGAARREVIDGVRFERRGTKLDVYLRTFFAILLGRYGKIDAVVDVQNGLPFMARLATRKPVTVLVHHVHREQWPVVYPGLVGRIGWWIESWLAPRVYHRCQYVAVSMATKLELIELGVDRDRIHVVHNGNDPAPAVEVPRARTPHIVVVGRLVPHKQVEHAIDAIAAMLGDHPDVILDIVGEGWWEDELRAHAALCQVSEHVIFHGFVDEEAKHRILAQSWVMALPSLKEGWGIVIGEAGGHGVPTVAYRSAGGTTESIDHKDTGVLVDSPTELIAALRQLIEDEPWRAFLGKGARDKSDTFSWQSSQRAFAQILGAA